MAVFLAAGCGGESGVSGGQPSASAAMTKDGAVAIPTARPEPTKGPGKSVDKIKASAPTSQFLDGRLLKAGLTCETCHGTLPAEGVPTLPDTDKCLSCHGGSHDVLIAKTAGLGERNPHAYHEGPLDCAKCHGVHKPFELYCNTCHSFAIPKKFQSGP